VFVKHPVTKYYKQVSSIYLQESGIDINKIDSLILIFGNETLDFQDIYEHSLTYFKDAHNLNKKVRKEFCNERQDNCF
jgi:hypothetical protein